MKTEAELIALIEDYYAALEKCGERYCSMQSIDTDIALFRFTIEFRVACRDRSLPLPKLCRWLGYIQGVLIERGFTTVEAERDWTRPLFRPLDFPDEQI